MIGFFDSVISLDVLDFFDPLNFYVEAPHEIQFKFDFLTYNKAAVLLRMFKEALTDATFTKGIRYYLADNQYQSVSPEDLHAALQKAHDEDFPGNNLDIGAMMHPWFELSGFPVVTVSRNVDGLHLTQERFRQRSNELFNIPISYATASHPNFENTTADLWLTTSSIDVPLAGASKPWTADDWVIFNLRDTGYYVTNYDDELWGLIIGALNNDHEAIHFLNRGTLFADFTRFMQEAYDVSATIFLEMMRSLPLENHPHVWLRAHAGLWKIEQRLRGSNLHQMHLNFMRTVMAQVYNTIEFTDFRATHIVNRWSCISGVQECLDDSFEVLLEVMETGSTDYEFDYRCNAFMSANETIWMHFFNDAMAQSWGNFDRLLALWGLICTQNNDLIKIYLDAVIDTTNDLQQFERQSMLSAAASESFNSFDETIDFVANNYQAIVRE